MFCKCWGGFDRGKGRFFSLRNFNCYLGVGGGKGRFVSCRDRGG